MPLSVAISKDVSWGISGNVNSFCLIGYHANGKQYSSANPLTYDSEAGGLGKTGGACDTTNLPVPSQLPSGSGGTVVAGRNLLTDSGLNTLVGPGSPSPLTVRNATPYYGAPWMVVDMQTPVSTKAIKIVTDDSSLPQGIIFFQRAQSLTDGGTPIANASQWWTVSAWVKTPAGIKVSVGWRPTSAQWWYISESDCTAVTMTGDWQRITCTIQNGPVGTFPGIQVKLGTSAAGITYYVAAPQVEVGNSLTEFEATP